MRASPARAVRIRCAAKPIAASAGPYGNPPGKGVVGNEQALEPFGYRGPDLPVEIIALRVVIGIGDVFIDVVVRWQDLKRR
jgi:hypothetical protein